MKADLVRLIEQIEAGRDPESLGWEIFHFLCWIQHPDERPLPTPEIPEWRASLVIYRDRIAALEHVMAACVPGGDEDRDEGVTRRIRVIGRLSRIFC